MYWNWQFRLTLPSTISIICTEVFVLIYCFLVEYLPVVFSILHSLLRHTYLLVVHYYRNLNQSFALTFGCGPVVLLCHPLCFSLLGSKVYGAISLPNNEIWLKIAWLEENPDWFFLDLLSLVLFHLWNLDLLNFYLALKS